MIWTIFVKHDFKPLQYICRKEEEVVARQTFTETLPPPRGKRDEGFMPLERFSVRA